MQLTLDRIVELHNIVLMYQTQECGEWYVASEGFKVGRQIEVPKED